LPGMSVKAEILTGKRRIIDFLLAPLRERMHDAMRRTLKIRSSVGSLFSR